MDVLCLRQRAQSTLATDLAIPVSMEETLQEVRERREQRRLEEWKVDVPTIGAIYSNLDKDGLYGEGPIVIFMSGLGRPCKWGSGLLKSRLCFLTSKKHKQDYKQRGTTTWG